MKAVIVQRYNGWEISEESGGPPSFPDNGNEATA